MFDACLMTERLTLKRDHFNGTATTALHHVDDGKSGLTITWDRVQRVSCYAGLGFGWDDDPRMGRTKVERWNE